MPWARKRRLSDAARDALVSYSWPGNVRELGNVLERALIVCDGEVITRDHLLMGPAAGGASAPMGRLAATERTLVMSALREAGGNRSAAARLLGITRSQLLTRLRRLGLNDPNVLAKASAPDLAEDAGVTDGGAVDQRGS